MGNPVTIHSIYSTDTMQRNSLDSMWNAQSIYCFNTAIWIMTNFDILMKSHNTELAMKHRYTTGVKSIIMPQWTM